MSIDKLPVTLERIFYPVQVVRALPNHDKDGDKHSNATSLNRSIDAVLTEKGKFALQLDIQIDLEKSVNPPYEIQLTAIGVFRVSDLSLGDIEMKQLVFDAGTTVLIGALRERIAMLTHSAPWGVFNINLIQVPHISTKEVQHVSPSSAGSTDARSKRPKKKATVKKKSAQK